MTSRDIVQYFEDRGFLANYWYDEDRHGYVFIIHKEGKYLEGLFIIPSSIDPRWFVDMMVHKFNKAHCSERFDPDDVSSAIEYATRDIEVTNALRMRIKDVIFNEPDTVVFWGDGSKTVVKCQEGDVFDPEKGLAMAIVKKIYGNKSSYCNEIKKWTEKYRVSRESVVDKCIRNIIDAMKKNGCINIYLDGKEV